ncbi:Mannose-1-phosphate guanylyltransferase [Crateriforma conspicua]|uniref:mannose-1-phosphate guanylyltransferase n=1 Tax=Crateriforma conspicua TaxID=2527996 RepID=A0A5C6G3G8_9PLAN|nr:mannose-1-phosphate guanylyltransferase [Crateriforma conspicua]TWU67743.1 Mannose-1-phosphate guanylyltransferase [Crateriforma conspicua]
MLHAVIMAGGSGTRFWPASRKHKPKQLLNLAGSRTMIQSTLDRLGDLVPPQRQRVITNQVLVDEIRKQLPDLPPENVVGEPCKRDTAPCVGLAAALVSHDDEDATMLVMPSDHVIADPAAFRDAVQAGQRLIDEDPDRIVTFGIRPTYPAESFGYIHRGEPIAAVGGKAFYVKRFREKPNRATAEDYLSTGEFYWNSGIFMWRASLIRDALARHQPEMHGHLQTIAEAIGRPDYADVLEREFTAIDGTSIDYAVMERHPNVVVIEAPFPWDDLGSWQSLSRLHEPDDHGNTVVANHIGIDTGGTIVHGDPDHTIVTIDVEDLVIVQTKDATLVAHKNAEERVREAVAELQKRGSDSLL